MTTPTYFSDLPNIDYSYKINKSGKIDKIQIKDYFHMMKVRDDIFKESSLYYTYNVINGERPEQVSQREYDDEQFYWVILQINGIVDYYSEWPLSSTEFTEMLFKKYGTDEKINEIHHWETPEVKNDDGVIVLEEGLIVSERFEYKHYSTPGMSVYETIRPRAITNLQYENELNEAKSEIVLMKKEYIYKYQTEMTRAAKKISKGSLESHIDIAEYYN